MDSDVGKHMGRDPLPFLFNLNANLERSSTRTTAWIIDDKKWGSWNMDLEKDLNCLFLCRSYLIRTDSSNDGIQRGTYLRRQEKFPQYQIQAKKRTGTTVVGWRLQSSRRWLRKRTSYGDHHCNLPYAQHRRKQRPWKNVRLLGRNRRHGRY